EGADLTGVLFSRSGFDAAGDIQSVGAHVAHRLGGVFRREAAGQQYPATALDGDDGEIPVESHPGAAVLVWQVAVEQPGLRRVGTEGLQRLHVLEAKAFDDFQSELAAKLRRLLSVKLQRVQATIPDGASDIFCRG